MTDRDRLQNYYERNRSYHRDRSYSRDSHIVGICCEATTTKMTIEMSIEITIRRKIIGISKTRDMKEGLEITMKMLMETDTEMTVMTRLNVGLRRKITCVMMMIYFTQELKEYTKFCKQ